MFAEEAFTLLRIILNPGAGAGRALAILKQVQELLEERDIEYETLYTRKRWHAADLTRQAAEEKAEGVVIIGGDGSLFEAANGLVGSDTVLYIVPCGTGNDFVRTLKLPKDPIEALRSQLDSPIVPVDAGAANEYRFLNIAGSGFDVEVLRQTEAYKQKYHGILPYLLGIIRGIRNYKPFEGELEIDGKTISGKFTVVVFANGQYYGGGMRVARKADAGDGFFDVIYVPALPKWFICLVLPLFIPGWYDVLPIVKRVRAKRAVLTSKGLTINMDGELRDMDRIEFSILSGGIKMALPFFNRTDN